MRNLVPLNRFHDEQATSLVMTAFQTDRHDAERLKLKPYFVLKLSQRTIASKKSLVIYAIFKVLQLPLATFKKIKHTIF